MTRKPGDWIPVSDRLPDNDVRVEVRAVSIRRGRRPHSTTWIIGTSMVTHWRPIRAAAAMTGGTHDR